VAAAAHKNAIKNDVFQLIEPPPMECG